MITNRPFLAFWLLTLLGAAGCSNSDKEESENYSKADYEFLAISNPDKMSLASKRALERNYHKNAEWFGRFHTQNLLGDFEFDDEVSRRDPSKVLLVDGEYYTWYTRATGEAVGFGTGDQNAKVFPWDHAEIWYATSKDGWTWVEQGMAVDRGVKGNFDDRSVFTPEVIAHNSKYYLVYQAVQSPYLNRSYNTVAMAVAETPVGPWVKLDKPILEPSKTGEWRGEEDNRFNVVSQGEFDSHKVHDPTLMFYRDKFYLYYKGERKGERLTAGGREIRWGVAIADNIQGPYKKSEYNPITHSGHELCVWHYKGGIALISSHDGPEKKTIQFAEDGINFEIMSYIPNSPSAMGLVESLDNDSHPTAGLSWGLHHDEVRPAGKSWLSGQHFIKRFSFTGQQEKTEFINSKKGKNN